MQHNLTFDRKRGTGDSETQAVAWLICLALAASAATQLGIIEPLGTSVAMAVMALIFLVAVRNPFIGLALIVLFSPLDAVLEHLTSSKDSMEFFMIATMGGIVANRFRDPHDKRLGPRDIVLRCAVMFGIALVLSIIFADSRDAAISYGQKHLYLIVVLFVVIKLVNTRERIEATLLCIIASSIFSSLMILHGSIGQMDAVRVAGGSYDATTSAATLLTGTAISLMLVIRTERYRWVTGAAVILGSLGMIYSLARSSNLVYAAGLLWFLHRHLPHRYRIAVILVGVGVAIAGVHLLPSGYIERFTALMGSNNQDWTLERRLGYQMIGLDLLFKNPLFGVGIGNFPIHYMDFDYRFVPGRTMEPRVLHNMYLSIAAETGLFGLIPFLAMIGAALLRVRRYIATANAPSPTIIYAQALLFGSVMYLIVAASLPADINKYTWILAGLLVAVSQVGEKEHTGSTLTMMGDDGREP